MSTGLIRGRAAWMEDLHELPHAPQASELWSENYFCFHHSLPSHIGIWLHLRHEPGADGIDGIWEEMAIVCLPDGDYLAAKGFGRGAVRRWLGGGEICCGGLTFRCEEPFRRWRYQFHGAARRLTREQMWRGPLADGLHVPVSLELEATGIGPPFDYGNTLEQSWASAHYDQHLQTRGRLRFQGETLEFDAAGMRDHSWGPRDWSKMARHAWIHAEFPDSARALTAFEVEAGPGHPEHTMLLATLIVGGSTQVVQASGWKLASGPDDLAESFDLTVQADDAAFVIRMEVVRSLPLMLLPGPEMGIGVPDPLGNATHDYVASFVCAEWDGEIGTGYSERTRLRR
jgi:hypothetical protein